MQESQTVQESNDAKDIHELLKSIRNKRIHILAFTLFCTIIAVFFAISMPDVYKSETTLAPISDDNKLKIPGQLGGLAALAGVNIGSGDGSDKTVLALEILKSREFLVRFIESNNLYIPIMASSGWNRNTNELLIDPEIYDVVNSIWVRKVQEPFVPKPSNLETYEEFVKLLSISQDKSNGIIKISFEHYSPFLAKEIVEKVVSAINDEIRFSDLNESEQSVDYLSKQIKNTNVYELKTMLFSLIEEQTKTQMLANIRKEYIFKTIDPPYIAEKKVKPKRLLIVVSVMFVSFFISFMFVVIRNTKLK